MDKGVIRNHFADPSCRKESNNTFTVIRSSSIVLASMLILISVIFFTITRMPKLKSKGFYLLIFGFILIALVFTCINSVLDFMTDYNPFSQQYVGDSACLFIGIYRTMVIGLCIIWASFTQAYTYFIVKYFSLALSI